MGAGGKESEKADWWRVEIEGDEERCCMGRVGPRATSGSDQSGRTARRTARVPRRSAGARRAALRPAVGLLEEDAVEDLAVEAGALGVGFG